jgi:hypothetical protein
MFGSAHGMIVTIRRRSQATVRRQQCLTESGGSCRLRGRNGRRGARADQRRRPTPHRGPTRGG